MPISLRSRLSISTLHEISYTYNNFGPLLRERQEVVEREIEREREKEREREREREREGRVERKRGTEEKKMMLIKDGAPEYNINISF